MTLGSSAALFGAMVVLALIPSVSVMTVSARSAAFGFIHGVCTAAGIVVADIIFILLAILGLSVLAESMGGLFFVVKYVGGAYLVWLGVALWRSGGRKAAAEGPAGASLPSSFLSGLFLTLADQKAIFFYLGFFPAFVDLSTISFPDAGIIVLITIAAVGGAKLCYAWAAARAGSLAGSKMYRGINRAAGAVMIGVGLFLIVRA